MAKPKYFLNEICKYISSQPTAPVPIHGAAVDSRLLKQGDLFFALPGAKVDGHSFLGEAAAKGVPAAVVSKNYNGSDFGMVLVRVDDPLLSMQEMTRQILTARRSKIIAVTGSVGKTTTKEFISGLLKHKYHIASTPGNSNSQIGMPLAILNHTDGSEEILILEMGMTEPGHIARLVNIAPPDIALITMVSLSHAANFENIQAIGRTKGEILSHPKTAIGIINRQIENYDEIAEIGTCRKLSFAVECSSADFTLIDNKEKGLLVKDAEGISHLETLKIPGAHNLHNFLAAAAAARCLEMSWEEINAASKQLKLPERRLEFIDRNGVLFVNDSYNASELSMKAALDTLPEPKPGGKKIAALGEMVELGNFSAQCHENVGRYALERVDEMLCLGEPCKHIQKVWKEAGRSAEVFSNRKDLVIALQKILRCGDVVLLKGSRAKEMWKVLEEL